MESKLTLHYLNGVLAPVTRVLLKSRTLQIFRLTSPPSYSSPALYPLHSIFHLLYVCVCMYVCLHVCVAKRCIETTVHVSTLCYILFCIFYTSRACLHILLFVFVIFFPLPSFYSVAPIVHYWRLLTYFYSMIFNHTLLKFLAKKRSSVAYVFFSLRKSGNFS